MGDRRGPVTREQPTGPITGVVGALPVSINLPGVGVVEVDWIIVGQAIDADNRSVLVLAPTPAFAQLTPELSALLFNAIQAVDQQTGDVLDPVAARGVIAGASSISTGRGLTPDDVFQQISNRAFVDTLIDAGLDERLLGFDRTQELLALASAALARGEVIPPQRIAIEIQKAAEDPNFRSPIFEGGQPLPGEAGAVPSAADAQVEQTQMQLDIARALQDLQGRQFGTEQERIQATIDVLNPLVGGIRESAPPAPTGTRLGAGRVGIEEVPQRSARETERLEQATGELLAAQTGGELRLTGAPGGPSVRGAQDVGRTQEAGALARAERSRQQQDFEALARRSRATAQRRAAI